ncbi:helix-turn-helix domain-containing protein [Brasilonema octagenarum UFV-E1]|uniref:Helix-turn-helix domain-containing protein n=1 Tax=Brasilonema sennae CENA114 TaxID=415709 RepID=A0A856MGF5_9CYAN|nr:helix-turn-helix domain-containing protein [Brasilonema sennae]QDL09712.1 helix-turn-helix domain-containing protein [Brasilonema sennae CENA114]QDL16066.1 helix-turn-helix domain-containing protein [Brasilonema octagenarum UFV-E1]
MIFEISDFYERKFLTPSQRQVLLKNLQANLQPEYRRRIEIMLLADVGKSQTQICKILGCSQEMARYWITVAQLGLAEKWQERPIGRPKIVNDQYIQRLKELFSHSPRKYGYAFSSWTSQWLNKHLATEFGIEISDRHINRLLKQMGLSTQKRSSKKQATKDTKETGSIKICDLQSHNEPNFHWLFNHHAN